MGPRPHAAGVDAFSGGELRKSFMSLSLNKETRTYGGGSGYRSEARAERSKTIGGNFDIKGRTIRIEDVTKTVLCRGAKRLSKVGYVPQLQAFKIPFVYSIEYQDAYGNTQKITNTNIR